MDDLQYTGDTSGDKIPEEGFKPCYKWMTFNTIGVGGYYLYKGGFKPCYKWMTFNTINALNVHQFR